MSVSQNFNFLTGPVTVTTKGQVTPHQTYLKGSARPTSAKGFPLFHTHNAQNPVTTKYPLVRGNASSQVSTL
jgi:hypothetical protein